MINWGDVNIEDIKEWPSFPSIKDACVPCDGMKSPTCPDCPVDESCAITSLTCTSCPSTYCTKKTSMNASGGDLSDSNKSSDSGSAVGGIVGGVVGGITLILLIALAFYYLKYWRHRKQRYGDMVGSASLEDEKAVERAIVSAGRDGTMNMGNVDSMYQTRNRSSAATVATRASNVLPVAYIPGVTAVGKKFRNRHLFNNGDTRSHITLGSSILGGDDDDFDDDSEMGSQAGDRNSSAVQHTSNLTTAIRAKPKLVQITEEDEFTYESDKERKKVDEDSQKSTLASPRTISTAGAAAGAGAGAVSIVAFKSTDTAVSVDPFILEGEEDDNRTNDEDEKEHRDQQGVDEDEDDDDGSQGSFILSVEVAEAIIRQNSVSRR